jgi:hypothetical protein
MKWKMIFGAVLGWILLVGTPVAHALNQETEQLLELLQNKKVITGEDADSFRRTLKKEMTEEKAEAVQPAGKSLLQKINERVTLGGLVEVEATASEDYEGANESDISLATVELGLDAEITDWVNGHILLLYEEYGSPLDVDEGFIMLGNLEQFPLYFAAGKMYVPFGAFETNLISDPLTLELGENSENAAQVGFEISGFYGSLYAFNGDIDETGEDNKIENFGVNAGYGFESDTVSLNLGAGWINNIASSDTLTDYFDDTIQDYVAGFTARMNIGYGPFSLIAEYLGAVDSFQALTELGFKGHGAQPKAWNLEAAYAVEIKGMETTFALGYQGTDEALELELPEERLLASIGMEIVENVYVGLEYLHDKDYSIGEEGTGNDADAVTMKLAVEF